MARGSASVGSVPLAQFAAEDSDFQCSAELATRSVSSRAQVVFMGAVAATAFAGATFAAVGHVSHGSVARTDGISGGGIFELSRASSPLTDGRGMPSRNSTHHLEEYRERCLIANTFKVGEQLTLGSCAEPGAAESPHMGGCPEDWPWEASGATGICRNADKSGEWGCAPGWQVSSAGCEKVLAEQFYQVDGTLTILSSDRRSALCAAMSKHQSDTGTALLLAECQPGFIRQRIGGMCLHGQESKPNAGAVVKPCPEKAAAPKAGVSLFCFMGVMPDSVEVALRDAAASRGAGIFACEANKVHTAWPAGTFDTPQGAFSANVAVFYHIWLEVFVDGIYKSHDWTVKVDPDCVFVPQRLRDRLWNFGVSAYEPLYIKNTAESFGFLGPIEVLSQAAVLRLAEMNLTKCPLVEWQGEDGWLHDCLDGPAGVPFREDTSILYGGGQIDGCSDSSHVAYHAYKDPWSWNSCADQTR